MGACSSHQLSTFPVADSAWSLSTDPCVAQPAHTATVPSAGRAPLLCRGSSERFPKSQRTTKAHTIGLVFLNSLCSTIRNHQEHVSPISFTSHLFPSPHNMYLLQQNSNKPGLGSAVLGACPLEMFSTPLFRASLDLPPLPLLINNDTHKHRAKMHLFSWGAFLVFSSPFCFSQCSYQRTPQSHELYLHIINVLDQMRTPERTCWCFLQMPSRINFGWNILS